MKSIPGPTLERLTRLYTILCRLHEPENTGKRLSSKALAELFGEAPHSLRKDLSILKTAGDGGSLETLLSEAGSEQGYDIGKLKEALGLGLGLFTRRSACLVGLGRLGGAILRLLTEGKEAYELAAAFDSSVNRLELLQTSVPLYHSREIVRVVTEKKIQLGIIAVPENTAQDAANRLAAGGISGIINYSQAVLSSGRTGVRIRNISLAGELNALSAYLYVKGE